MVSKQPTIPVVVQSAIIERQGFDVYGEMLDTWTDYEIANHFAEHYKVVEVTAHESYILDVILDMLRTGELETMIRHHRISDIIECAKLSGFVSELHDQYVISVEYPNEVVSRW